MWPVLAWCFKWHLKVECTNTRTNAHIHTHRRVSHGLGWPANAMLFLQQNSQKAIFTLPVVNDNEIVRRTSTGVEGKSGLICLVCHTRSCWCQRVRFAISSYPWHYSTFTYYGSLEIEKLIKIVLSAKIGSSQALEAGSVILTSFVSLIRTGNFLRDHDVILAPLFSRHFNGSA